MNGQRNIPKEWKENESLIGVSKILGRSILNTNDLTNEDYWNIILFWFKDDMNRIVV